MALKRIPVISSFRKKRLLALRKSSTRSNILKRIKAGKARSAELLAISNKEKHSAIINERDLRSRINKLELGVRNNQLKLKSQRKRFTDFSLRPLRALKKSRLAKLKVSPERKQALKEIGIYNETVKRLERTRNDPKNKFASALGVSNAISNSTALARQKRRELRKQRNSLI